MPGFLKTTYSVWTISWVNLPSIISFVFVLKIKFSSPYGTARFIKQIQVTWNETLALEGRGAYYDRAGALKDMIQIHLLQMLAVLTMETGWGRSAEDFREHRLQLF